MATPLRVLIVEDSEDDAELLLLELRRVDYEVLSTRVETANEMQAALELDWDVVISDYSLPHFDAHGALRAVAESGVDVPLIIVSGTIGEETAVEALHAGARDFLVKGKLSRLRPAIERELRERASRRARRDAEEALRVSDLRFKRLWESGIVGITVADPSGKILEANDAFLSMVGHSTSELATNCLNWERMTPPELWRFEAAAAAELRARGHARPWEKEFIRKNGDRVPVLVALATLEGARHIAVSLDLRERKQLEQQFRQAQKMEAVGSLAAGVAHDFNNLLSVILSYASLILEGLGSDDPLQTEVMEIKKAGERARDVTQQLLAFSRKQMLQPRVLDLGHIALGMEKMLRRLLREDIQLSFLTPDAVGKVQADRGQVEQIIMNLVVNARDAMPNGGQISVEIENVNLGAEYAASHHDVAPGVYVMLAISDTGIGMDAVTRERIFEPFFTTKGPGEGTGLGLSTVYGIVKQSGGHIWVYSELGVGTTFKVYFPRTDAKPETGADTPAPLTLRGSETILVVEDEAMVRRAILMILRKHGYKVLEAQSGADAAAISKAFDGEIHLLITDVVMPRMSGRALAEMLTPERPHMKVLFVSGYTEKSIVNHGVLECGIAFLPKPIIPPELARKVREVLEAPIRATS